MKKIFLSLFCVLATGMLAGSAFGGEAEVRQAWETTFKTKADSVTKSGYLGLYEVIVGGEAFYTDEKVSAVIRGDLIDAKTKQNITQERLFAKLPLDQAVKQVRGNGKRIFVTFEDPNCGYCKKLARDMATLDNVTIYTFLYPILTQDSMTRSQRIWCAPDRGKSWYSWMTQGVDPPQGTHCDVSAINKNLELGRNLGVNGTPSIFFADGERSAGAIPLAQIERALGPAAD